MGRPGPLSPCLPWSGGRWQPCSGWTFMQLVLCWVESPVMLSLRMPCNHCGEGP